MYFEAVVAIKTRLEQPSFRAFLNLEQPLLNAISSAVYEEQTKEMLNIYGDDIDAYALTTEKTWLRSRMSQSHFNALAILSTHKELTDHISLVSVGNEFVANHHKRYETFGKILNFY